MYSQSSFTLRDQKARTEEATRVFQLVSVPRYIGCRCHTNVPSALPIQLTLPKARRCALIEQIMATPAITDDHESEGWHQDELSEMKSLLQRAEQRMRKLDPTSKHTMKHTKSYEYAMVAHLAMLRI